MIIPRTSIGKFTALRLLYTSSMTAAESLSVFFCNDVQLIFNTTLVIRQSEISLQMHFENTVAIAVERLAYYL
ncbi:hypothetical protein T07_996 [Trichinella nelsoni]|uniref:Uncharacterized protein n=1 Tax=Trichinella nelsoni TaxID=6336 RepID=A0A0V0RQU1_9BILA|nr:hypothetical protein T07_996 [Trichinella nelsoni]